MTDFSRQRLDYKFTDKGSTFNFNENADVLRSINGSPAVIGKRDDQFYVRYRDQEYGPYSDVENLQEIDGELVFLSEKEGITNLIVDGKKRASYDNIRDIIFYNETLVFAAKHGDKEFIVKNGKEGPSYDKVKFLQLFGEKIMYVGIDESKGVHEVVLDGHIQSNHSSIDNLLTVGNKTVIVLDNSLFGDQPPRFLYNKKLYTISDDSLLKVYDMNGKIAYISRGYIPTDNERIEDYEGHRSEMTLFIGRNIHTTGHKEIRYFGSIDQKPIYSKCDEEFVPKQNRSLCKPDTLMLGNRSLATYDDIDEVKITGNTVGYLGKENITGESQDYVIFANSTYGPFNNVEELTIINGEPAFFTSAGSFSQEEAFFHHGSERKALGKSEKLDYSFNKIINVNNKPVYSLRKDKIGNSEINNIITAIEYLIQFFKGKEEHEKIVYGDRSTKFFSDILDYESVDGKLAFIAKDSGKWYLYQEN